MNDLKFAFRQLLKNRGFTATALLLLALGIGVNSTIFSVRTALFSRSLSGVKNLDELVSLDSAFPGRKGLPLDISYLDYLDFRGLTNIFADAAVSGRAFQRVFLDAGKGPNKSR